MQQDEQNPGQPDANQMQESQQRALALASARPDRALSLDLPNEERDSNKDEIDLRHYWQILLRRKWTVLAALGIVFFTVLVATLLMTPVYRASTTIQIDRDTQQVVQVQGMNAQEGYGDETFYATQYELLRSAALSERVASQLHLANDPIYLHLQNPSSLSRLRSMILPGKKPEKTLASDADSAALGDFVNAGLNIEPVKDTRLVQISFDSTNPQLAARIANAVADNFIAANLEHTFNASAYARSYLEGRLAQLKQKLEESEAQLVAVADKEGIFLGADGKTSLPSDKLAALNIALAGAEDARIGAEARWRQASASSGTSLSSDLLTGSIVAQLRQNRVDLMGQYQQKLSVYKPGYPSMLALKGQIDELDKQISAEFVNVKSAAHSQYQAALAHEQLLQQQMDEAKSEVLTQQNHSIRYNVIQRDVSTNQQLYDALLQRYKEIGVAGGITTNNMSVVDRAAIPGGPYKPDLRRNLLLGTLFGLALGVGLALFFDYLDDTLKTSEDIEKQLQLAVLGVIPRLKDTTPLEALKDQRSAFAEAYRSVRTALQFSTDHGVPRTLLITSSSPSEGKSTTALSLARNFAQLGKRVLLIDADLRNPSQHRTLGLDNDKGLSNVLSGAAKPQDVIQHLAEGDLDLLTSGPVPPNPGELLAGAKMLSLLTVAMAKYDQVILDGPPTMGIADAVILSHIAEGTLMVVDSGATRREVARRAVKRLAAGRARLIGVLLTKFDANVRGYYYSYADQGYYSYGGDQAKLAKQ